MTRSIRNRVDLEGCEGTRKSTSEKPNLAGDWLNFYLLIILYIIQGFPIGLSGALPIILQSKKMVTYEDQAAFSISLWPYSIKLLWAPVVDALYVKCIGRRKCWLLPLQLLMGLLILYMASNIDDWLPESGKPNLTMLITVVFVVNILSATQDIVVDGWALTMLKKKNVGYASTCNSVGVPFGMFIGSVCFTLLVSEQFNITYFRATPGTGGLITMKSFLYFYGTMTLVLTSIVGIFKKEKDSRLEDGYVNINVFQNYKLLWDVLKLPRIRVLAVALLTTRIAYTATDSISHLKLIDAGVSKDDIMIITSALYIIKFIMPIFVSEYITGPKPMSYFLKITPFRLIWCTTYVALIYYTPSMIRKDGLVSVPTYYYFIMGLVLITNEVLNFFLFLTLFAFFCRLSDPRFGGTYMTLFNTFYYMGFLLSNTLVLKLVAFLTFRKCSNNDQNTCSTSDLEKLCKTNEGSCVVSADGYNIVVAISLIIGFIWYFCFRNIIKKYQSLSASHWMINIKRPVTAVESCLIPS
ncbi:acetyl-coenzyme A transporter 1-like [Myzus persicae]|uniref:acetyl-coenzyme A transporter 1-like n=1 Tax=Myzus persicae TaxID=13164 RepID=UPI000B934197|nr:acetyl-coenzyme A transporter 1-like [Myzus persicae]XP_022174746.1 acetyl-coenzyme A transporter 1-like [Myzus persicae]XP_022174747.1 acetyl-coenzyme A transporter 1-like [Myzus persicae]XP_022174748.1 acetyl-coenzyme A transporter 1-like [Myzus persicae]XP_022174750.1 acetyl-coenzyme A transporter 1-like [Myzus persicae]XP_022174751.1 acetyl-coenzyme A transporter 1-like [Myzus persicae]